MISTKSEPDPGIMHEKINFKFGNLRLANLINYFPFYPLIQTKKFDGNCFEVFMKY